VTKRSVVTRRGLALSLAAGLLLQACSRPSPPVEKASAAPADAAAATPESAPAFVSKLWKVSRSSGVEPGTLYVFFADGTLLITSSHGTPALGRWEYAGDTLTLIEEGTHHPATVQRLQADTFAITLRGGGAPLDITFVRETAP
jgi:hypothetical protein